MSKQNVSNSRGDRDRRKMNADDSKNGREIRDAAGQIRELDSRLGVGVGAVKERSRLAAISGETKSKKPVK